MTDSDLVHFPDLVHFIEAQKFTRDSVIAELTAGQKRTHWMWFVFPQLAGLGTSAMAHRYAIANLDHARRYLADSILGARLREATRLVLVHKGAPIRQILGSPDDMKFRSCVTLFRAAASNATDRALFDAALDAFYGGKPDSRTLDLLNKR